jgi:1,4-dihydroxy-6-naphthoate synthase
MRTKSKILTLGFSPCPNDCFIFDALLHHKVDTEGLQFKPVMEDVESLNKKAFNQLLDISKLSFFAYASVLKKYTLLDAGAALGFGVGPLLVSKKKYSAKEINHLTVAIPGKHTTANLLFSLAYPLSKNKKEMLFSDIENAILTNHADAGVIIHESRFTYKEKRLKKIIDLGAWWEKKTNSPIPLGGIAIRKSIDLAIQKKVNRAIRRSVEYAFKNPASSKPFIKLHAQEMNSRVIQKHIQLYVNDFSISLGTQGRQAIRTFLKHAEEML